MGKQELLDPAPPNRASFDGSVTIPTPGGPPFPKRQVRGRFSRFMSVVRAHPELDKPEYFFNRELSWLEFNHRVLEEALDPGQPLLERVRFLSIVGTNLDEFFEVRIAGLKQQIDNKSVIVGPDHLTATEVYAASEQTSPRTRRLASIRVGTTTSCPHSTGRTFSSRTSMSCLHPALVWADRLFSEELFPVLTPLAVDPSHPFPQLGKQEP